MGKQVFINFPVTDLEKSTAFYEALGFVKNPMFSDENASSMQWSDDIVFMILKRDYYQTFLNGKTVAFPATTSGVLVALTLDSKEEVQAFAETAKANGGNYFKAGPEIPEDMMFGYEVTDPDGNQIEPVWMNANFDPQA